MTRADQLQKARQLLIAVRGTIEWEREECEHCGRPTYGSIDLLNAEKSLDSMIGKLAAMMGQGWAKEEV